MPCPSMQYLRAIQNKVRRAINVLSDKFITIAFNFEGF
jgi:hypothetical protein